MITEITQKIYETLSQDSTLQGLIPHVKDNSNIWEMRTPAEALQFPVIVFRVVSGAPLLGELALDAYNWFVEIDILDNQNSMTRILEIYNRIYTLLQSSNMSSGNSKSYRCQLDFFNTDYDSRTLVNFVTTRWQIFSIEIPAQKISDLG